MRRVDAGLSRTGLERGPWLVVAVIAGIALWLALPTPAAWVGAVLLALCGVQVLRGLWEMLE